MANPTPEQAKQLVSHFGTQRNAAKGCGVAKSTFQKWLHPHYVQKSRERGRRYWHSLPEETKRAQAERVKARAARLVEAGLCRSCGKPRVTGEYCRVCADKSNARNRRNERKQEWHKKRYEYRRANDLCTGCGSDELYTWTTCYDCSSKKAETDARRYWGVDLDNGPGARLKPLSDLGREPGP